MEQDNLERAGGGLPMKKKFMPKVFDTNRRIKLGIWGLGRGMSFYRTCSLLNIDVVAGCDFNEHMRRAFSQHNPKAFVTANADEFLAQDFDAVLLATFCPAHAADAIKCLRAGKHVLSEVTAFHTMAEGVQLVEEVEKSGRIYNLAENYPFTPVNMYLARKWKEGLFGELMYAEYEYAHECRSLCYTYIDGVPIQPGNRVHSWRSWLNYHYYCTHSLGPVMVITGTRPVRVVALPSGQKLAGYLMGKGEGMGGIAPSLINMSNGGIVRNLMGATTNDSHVQRLWGTLGSAELNVGHQLQLRLGASGDSPKFPVAPKLDSLGELAAKTGHGGGDFWVLYYFARQIFTGEQAPFDIYSACDVTIPGILAARSSMEGGRPYDVPDFRKKEQREPWRNDNWAQKRYDTVDGVFPKGADYGITGRFSATMRDLIRYALMYRAYADWGKVQTDMVEPTGRLDIIAPLVMEYDKLVDAYTMARRIANAYPGSDGARVLMEMLEIGMEKEALAAGVRKKLAKELSMLRKKRPPAGSSVVATKAAGLLPPARDIRKAGLPAGRLAFKSVPYSTGNNFVDIRCMHDGRDGLVFVKMSINSRKAGKARLLFGADGPVKVWMNKKSAACAPDATNPCIADQYHANVTAKKGTNEVIFALNTNQGQAWGVMGRLVFEK